MTKNIFKYGTNGNDTIFGSNLYNDYVYLYSGKDYVSTGDGNDVVRSGTGKLNDIAGTIINTGNGNDTIIINGKLNYSLSILEIIAGNGNDQVYISTKSGNFNSGSVNTQGQYVLFLALEMIFYILAISKEI